MYARALNTFSWIITSIMFAVYVKTKTKASAVAFSAACRATVIYFGSQLVRVTNTARCFWWSGGYSMGYSRLHSCPLVASKWAPTESGGKQSPSRAGALTLYICQQRSIRIVVVRPALPLLQLSPMCAIHPYEDERWWCRKWLVSCQKHFGSPTSCFGGYSPANFGTHHQPLWASGQNQCQIHCYSVRTNSAKHVSVSRHTQPHIWLRTDTKYGHSTCIICIGKLWKEM